MILNVRRMLERLISPQVAISSLWEDYIVAMGIQCAALSDSRFNSGPTLSWLAYTYTFKPTYTYTLEPSSQN